MSRRDDSQLLRDMLDHARLARDTAKGRTRGDFDNDPAFRAACERFVEIVGEAASNVSDAFRQSNGDIPWRKIGGTRNMLAHGYLQIDLDILWDIIEIDIPRLIESLERECGE